MSEHGFHVHGAHEHAVEHEAHSGAGMAQYVAIFTAILSTIGAIVSYEGAATQNDAMLLKNDAVLKKTQASDQWNYYQAKSQKGHLMEMMVELAPADRKDYYRKQVEKYEDEKKKIQADAQALDLAAKAADGKSEEMMRPHHFLALAMTLLQISIALASVTALTRKTWLFGVAAVSAAGGLVLWTMALL